MAADAERPAPRAPLWLVGAAFGGGAAALLGGYWDDAWHTERGRDSLFILPHVFIYSGVALIGSALTVWVADTARRVGARSAFARPGVRLAAISVAVTLASGAIDDVWHRAFGRDAVIWSPPHMLGIVGTMVLGAALLGETARRGRAWSACAGALVLAAANFVVVEYDTDVPQFGSVWYLPVLAVASSIAFALVRLTTARAWAAGEAAATQLVFVLVAGAFLLSQGFDPPALPLLVAPALALDLAARRGWRAPGQAGVFVAALFAVYVPVRNWLGAGVELDAADVLVGLPLAYLATLPFLLLASGGNVARVTPAAAAAAVVAALLVLAPAAAVAHDPGQGEDAGTARLVVAASDRRLALSGALNRETCGELRSGALVARRAGVEWRAPLRLDDCAFRGAVSVDARGRWFVYAELQEDGRTIESWLPIEAGAGTRRVADPERFAYFPPERSAAIGELVGGAALYGAMVALLGWALLLLRRAGVPAATRL